MKEGLGIIICTVTGEGGSMHHYSASGPLPQHGVANDSKTLSQAEELKGIQRMAGDGAVRGAFFKSFQSSGLSDHGRYLEVTSQNISYVATLAESRHIAVFSCIHQYFQVVKY